MAAIAPVAIISLATYFFGSFDCSRLEESPMPKLMHVKFPQLQSTILWLSGFEF